MTEIRPDLFDLGDQRSVALVAPAHWSALGQALAKLGLLVRHVWPPSDTPEGDQAPCLIDLRKAAVALGAPELSALLNCLPVALVQQTSVERDLHQINPRVVVTTCTADVPGRASWEWCRQHRLPLVHVSHSTLGAVPEEAWFAREAPGDLVVVAGERCAAWWERCAPGTHTVVTGHPLWDEYGAIERPVPRSRPVVVWLAESGANALQTSAIWKSRAVPELAWQAFCLAVRKCHAIGTGNCGPFSVILKVRSGEDEALVRRWCSELGRAVRHPDIDWHLSPEPLADVLRTYRVALVIGQDSSGLVQALCAGVPVLSITRRGGSLFDYPAGAPYSWVVDGESTGLGERLAQAMQLAASAQTGHTDDWRELGRQYNAGIDGRGMDRTVQTIAAAVGGLVA